MRSDLVDLSQILNYHYNRSYKHHYYIYILLPFVCIYNVIPGMSECLHVHQAREAWVRLPFAMGRVIKGVADAQCIWSDKRILYA